LTRAMLCAALGLMFVTTATAHALETGRKTSQFVPIINEPCTPRTNGKAERFIRTSLREWAYATANRTSEHRKRALLPWLHS
jgi:transposase InsO family protein